MTRPIRRAVVVLSLMWAGGAAHAAPAPELAASFGNADAHRILRVQAAADIVSLGPVMTVFVAGHPDIRVEFEQWNTNELYDRVSQDCRTRQYGADIVISSAADLQLRLVDDGCAQPWLSAGVAALPAGRNWRNELFGITQEPAVIVYNRALVPADQAPLSRFALLDALMNDPARYRGKVATYDIERSGVGYLFAFSDSLQASTFGRLIQAFRQIGTEATCCSAEIIDGVAQGRWLIAYNMLGSSARRAAAINPDLAVILPEDYTLMLSRAAYIPKTAAHPAEAGALIDFLLSPDGQAELTRQGLIWSDAEMAQHTGWHRIDLSPVLLLGLDREKRRAMLADWRAGLSLR